MGSRRFQNLSLFCQQLGRGGRRALGRPGWKIRAPRDALVADNVKPEQREQRSGCTAQREYRRRHVWNSNRRVDCLEAAGWQRQVGEHLQDGAYQLDTSFSGGTCAGCWHERSQRWGETHKVRISF